MKIQTLLSVCLIVLATIGSAVAQSSDWKVMKSYPVPGDGGFDYVVFEPSAARLYLSHGTKVDVLEAGSGRIVGAVQNTPGVHGIAVVPELHRGFTSNGGDATVSVFDTSNLQTLQTIAVDKDPDYIFYDAGSKRVFVCHGDADEITVIDPQSSKVVGKIALGGGAEAAVVDGASGFVNLEEESSVVHFDASKMSVLHRWPITGGKTPTGLAMDKSSKRLFIGCRSKVLAVMDATNGRVITTLPIGERVDAVAFDPKSHLIFTSNGGGTISIIHQDGPDAYTKVSEVATEPSAKTMAFDPASNHLFLTAAEMQPLPAGATGRPRPKAGTFHVLVVGQK